MVVKGYYSAPAPAVSAPAVPAPAVPAPAVPAPAAPTTIAKTAIRVLYKFLILLMHLMAAVMISYAIYYDHTYVVFPKTTKMYNPFGGKFKYLTFLDAIIQAAYFTICLINDVFGTNEVLPKKMPAIRKIKDYLLAALAFPVALNVGISFWSLYAVDRELVLPKELDTVFPGWLNHIMHTNIMVFMILEMFTSFREYPSRRKGLTGLITFLLTYLVWIHVIKHFSGFWVYPVLEALYPSHRVIFFIGLFAFTIGLYLLGEFINNTVWAKELKLLQRKIQ